MLSDAVLVYWIHGNICKICRMKLMIKEIQISIFGI